MQDNTNSKTRFGRLLLTSFLVVGMLVSGTAAVSAHEEHERIDTDAISLEPVSVDKQDDLARFAIVNDNDAPVTLTYEVSGTDVSETISLDANEVKYIAGPTGDDERVTIELCYEGEVIETASSNDVMADLGAPNADASEIRLSAESTDRHDDLARFAIVNDDEVPATLTYKVFGTDAARTISLDGNDVKYVAGPTGDDERVTVGLYYKGELIDVKTNAERTTDLGPENPKNCDCVEG